MLRFIFKNIFKPFPLQWVKGVALLLAWTVSFIALPAISGWFLASCSLAFIVANSMFSYLIPSSIVRMLAVIRTISRYFERLNNHKTTLDAQSRLQLRIFKSVASLPYFKKQVNNNSSILENSTYGIDQILNHVLLWVLPFSTLIVAIVFYFFFLNIFSTVIAIEFVISSAVLLFFVPQFILIKNKKIYAQIKYKREQNNQELIESFRGRIEITKYNLVDKAINQQEKSKLEIEQLEKKLQANSYILQLLAGFGFSCLAIFIFWHSYDYGFDAPLAIGVFFGILAQSELSEILFSGKSEKSSVAHQIKDISSIIDNEVEAEDDIKPVPAFEKLTLKNLSAQVPETPVKTNSVDVEITKGDWIALYGVTGKGKTTLLNSLFYPEYKLNGTIIWNEETDLSRLPVPECIYVTQKAYLLTGTLKENFEGHSTDEVEAVIKTVDLTSWYKALPNGINTWLGENGETLSGGQRKKLLLAQALLKQPQVLVVDEPTAGISTENAIEIFHTIKKQYPHLAILMCTHLKDFESEVDTVIKL